MSRAKQNVTKPTRRTIRGIVQQVDLINRMLVLRTAGSELEMTVPPSCEILVNGQCLRLHVVQPADRVIVALEEDHRGWLARQIEVNSLA